MQLVRLVKVCTRGRGSLRPICKTCGRSPPIVVEMILVSSYSAQAPRVPTEGGGSRPKGSRMPSISSKTHYRDSQLHNTCCATNVKEISSGKPRDFSSHGNHLWVRDFSLQCRLFRPKNPLETYFHEFSRPETENFALLAVYISLSRASSCPVTTTMCSIGQRGAHV